MQKQITFPRAGVTHRLYLSVVERLNNRDLSVRPCPN
jgi:hypothetical protein